MLCFVGATNFFRDWSTNWFLDCCRVSSPIVAQCVVLRMLQYCVARSTADTNTIDCLTTSPVFNCSWIFMVVDRKLSEGKACSSAPSPTAKLANSFYSIHTTLFSDLNSDWVSFNCYHPYVINQSINQWVMVTFWRGLNNKRLLWGLHRGGEQRLTSKTGTWWRRSVVVSALSSIDVVNRHWARLVLGWVTVCGRVNHLGM